MAAVAAAVTLALAPGAARAVGPRPTVVEAVTVTAAGVSAAGAVTPTARPRPRPPEISGFLTVVNKARADVGVPPLVWDESVAAHARHWARVRVADCELIHSNSRYGENLARGSDPRYSLSDAARLWLDEKSDYDRPSNSCVNDRECLHYTQLVWRTSTRVGAARARCGDGWTYVVANFDPPGNWLGRRPY
ncbi:pathogenesis-related family 1 protein [Streptomyces europaeiscabiei]|uniref:pathogenesis-related family 1 protein n=1 Tax=Streptomyces europaeiscabiei TaxID=146819 RepID=UPI00099EC5D3|nr:pathogenesis-related family 1 protein [Streptomyces europaeiscabiei]MDX2527673.1 pathogenesis-related family 1 protein [Streptomyces europaeiscabiei]MDX3671834.1 pathogenesis-related family 1 protein [Streptomyces europaeiscabiei]MDX3831260.1 pathogenesis-related family 1 protein [Streptomyces europaeiscabiei]MDX3841519.1 pathogenesis-related family 1 protein [Streptomyces europaeiscabiei]MDX3862566.1 pathogenesis-related family 1 protein [Streptomyces europaeiscabiei]